jgi:UDP-N-acetylmuramyl pentapeptide phosphotransferase/UDP-N-acetylglucosamine-1-phosphate transferase
MSDGAVAQGIVDAAVVVLVAAAISAGLIAALYPGLKRHALAVPNERSSHRSPTPQGGGIAVIAATACAVALAAANLWLGVSFAPPLPAIAAALLLMTVLGAAADFWPLAAPLRLIPQAILVAAVIATLPADTRVIAALPWWIERLLLVLGGLWFVNLVNFMDGIDWITVAEVVPVCAAATVLGIERALPAYGTVSALALAGATIGFAYFNRPVARLFLGDVGSLPIGLILGWLMLLIAGSGHVVAAIIMPLYYLADATLTLLRRLLRRERIFRAHRSHFYQRAIDHGFSVYAVVGRVFAVNLVLGALAVLTVIIPGGLTDAAALGAGTALVAWLLWIFARAKTSAKPWAKTQVKT